MRDLFILFDIDGTLVRKAGPHAAALSAGILAETGRIVTAEGIPTAGMLDVDILTLMLRKAGFGQRTIREALPGIMRRAERAYRKQCPGLTDRVIPGVHGLLGHLKLRRVKAGLVTGNLRRIGWRKVERAGLREHFLLGAFSGEGKTRADLAARAISEARRRGHLPHGGKVVLVGDTPNDIEAAKITGIPCVATATGVYPSEELAKHSPSLLVTSLEGLTAEGLRQL